MEKKPIIRLQDVWKVYQLGKVDVRALQGVNLEVETGCFVTIMGPSGSGKSTLLNMIGCLDAPSKGKIFLDKEDTSVFSESKLSQIRGKKIGFIFQQFNLLHNLTALENVMLPMVFQGILQEKRINRAEHLLDLVGLKERAKHLPAELSGGERQRVAIARAFANEPELVIADEPTGNLDSHSGKKVMEMLTKFHQEEKGTLVVVTHDPMIAEYSEQVINIKDGQIIKNHSQAEQVLWQK
ncbi:ABC transporter ATP-binding protein [Patescibacteria group bacterium]|nr:ABC transporter ATP-binding protein [Patescibacteria group bacterium]MBU4023013.1 ABC transporter ATP-binding protein [Patescibacteria group bacterium]